MDKFESRSRITGIGMSQVGRRLGVDPVGLAIDACIAALADAGLTRRDIDGLACHMGPVSSDGYSGAGIIDVEEVLRIHPRWFVSGHEMAGHSGPLLQAALAIAAGLCRHVLIFRCTWETTALARARSDRDPAPQAPWVEGDHQWRLPFGAFSPANWIALYADRHFNKYGTTREQLGAIALNARANAALNAYAVYKDPLTMDDYLSARMISTPLGLYDCDVPCDGAVAMVLSAADAARDTRRPNPIRIEAMGGQTTERWSWDQDTIDHEPLMKGAASSMWARTDLKPADVAMAQIYDGFTFNCLSWIETLGFCPTGEGGRFVEGGTRIALDGELPINTHGGQLSAGRLQGYGFLHEACVQLWGEAGDRQVPGDPQVSVVTTGGGAPGGAILLTQG
ncbi:acetyl-CoA acetyltransferase [Novosphingobium hassiacum]|uniref:Acetyl-CoA acetyltransferase n=1 Tax=Novosphingobium hassiacum TaxID=173676 RepID=A0A7W5ZXJ5_9SPHN|nr:thiolase family protein [Novosphingobium hassiacum]MBB3860968.1 acetyl-CoA acetyltransferase [Novosphingobium hassiacum]